MSNTKKIILWIVNITFRFSLFFGLTLLALYLVIASPDGIKQSITDVDGYNRFSDALVQSAKDSSQANIDNSLPFDRPEIDSALKTAVGPKTVQAVSDTVINSAYDWLKGSSDSIRFSVDLRANKKLFAEQVADYATQRLNNLPQCFSPSTTDVFRVDCYPYGTNLPQLKTEIRKLVLDSDIIVRDDILTDKALVDSDGIRFDQKNKNFPTYFKLFEIAPFVLLGISVICAFLIVALARTRYRGLRKLTSMVISSAVILAITPIIYTYVLPAVGFKMPSLGADSSQGFSSIFGDITTNLYSRLNASLLNIAVQLAVVGVVLWIIARFVRINSSIYVDLDKKSGLATSEKKKPKSTGKNSKIPIQTSEGAKRPRKKIGKLEKKYKKM